MNILIFIIILLVLVLVHEFGHFFAAKKFGIRVDEFGFGFPPRLFSFKKGEIEYSFNLLPIGGFVKIFGENPDEENTFGPDASRSFINKPKYKQAVVLFAGVFANFLLAWFLFSLGFMSGLPTSVGNEPRGYSMADTHLVVVSVLADSPAEKAGLKSGDKIVYIKSNNLDTNYISPETVRSFVASGNKIEIGYLRGKDTIYNTVEITPQNDNGSFFIGISMDQIGIVKLPVLTAFWEGLKLDWFVTKGTVVGLYTLIKEGIEGRGSLASVTGPVGMVGIVGNAYQFGFVYLLSFSALISVNLAIINLIPFPALDGGRLFFLLIEKIKGSRLNPKFANTVNMVGFAVLIILMLLVTYHDVVKLF
ncbi:MAG: Membrane-associated zinc metalloprotease [Candidatus Nomurabacteria bacterium GW2011_GWF2_35_12]|uniref:Zinc metalloprotease n=3 Tax=Candidatus Nomuraibacteriota TaxID=1752729 RepID=A0A0G0DY28_9BACT|nr:MAG: Membrane-associated zinc metalloprotease [Candidatus Nomurabacteria bacterium GW2011_GWF2_35_12]KKP72093.1 MAG: Membrane-associated zinc metalloprotease [Candidatus Nomurabacteria bacterium GW2011_GWB1_35_20]KKP76438.1 MAG: Membrane-associated zinc metalloprotease [Parcubacteria group bacterium GW2011_GWC1_35_21]KKP78133.1 MAG: Membrane-associated zinc metalloprotease [Candidatus Nomurabacteria bacterium GW2011_GWC2_35_35]KKP88105.1 MAG: Membrane-associated zinc metalloprotease [Candida